METEIRYHTSMIRIVWRWVRETVQYAISVHEVHNDCGKLLSYNQLLTFSIYVAKNSACFFLHIFLHAFNLVISSREQSGSGGRSRCKKKIDNSDLNSLEKKLQGEFIPVWPVSMET